MLAISRLHDAFRVNENFNHFLIGILNKFRRGGWEGEFEGRGAEVLGATHSEIGLLGNCLHMLTIR